MCYIGSQTLLLSFGSTHFFTTHSPYLDYYCSSVLCGSFSLLLLHHYHFYRTTMSSLYDSENSPSPTPTPLHQSVDVEMEDVQPTSATFPSSSTGRVSGYGGISGSYTVGVRPSSKKFKNRHVTGSLNRLQQQTNGLRIDEGFFQRLNPKPFVVGKRYGNGISLPSIY